MLQLLRDVAKVEELVLQAELSLLDLETLRSRLVRVNDKPVDAALWGDTLLIVAIRDESGLVRHQHDKLVPEVVRDFVIAGAVRPGAPLDLDVQLPCTL